MTITSSAERTFGTRTVPTSRPRLAGVDSIRAVAAFWVVLSHVGFVPLPLALLNAESGPLVILRGLYNCMFSGPSAVIVFFLISGLVIHLPQAGGETPVWRDFLARRYVRIGIPLIVALTLTRGLGLVSRIDEVLWSLYAELVYYSLYPMLLLLSRRIGWTPLLAASWIGYCFTVVLSARGTNYAGFPVYSQWMVGLPAWLCGCILAQRVYAGDVAATTGQRIWFWRAGIFVVSWASVLVNFHGAVLYAYTQNVFAFGIFLWLEREIFRYNDSLGRRPWRFLEASGRWSYSLYLTHPLIAAQLALVLGERPALGGWSLLFCGTVLSSYLFYLLVERPSHKLSSLFKARDVYPG